MPGADATQPSWLLRLDASGDGFLVLRAPPGSGSYTNVAAIDSTGKLYATLVGGSVGRTQLGVNAIYGASTTSPCPAPFSLSTPVGQWVNYMTLSPITTRGGLVMLKAQYNLAGIGAVSGAQTIAVRWLRSGSPLTERAWLIATATATALPALELMDNPPAGTYTYSMQLWISASCLIVGTASAQGFLQAIEIG